MVWLLIIAVALAIPALGVLIWVNALRFRISVEVEALRLWATPASTPAPPRQDDAPPAPVQRYLERTLGLRAAPVKAVRLRHGGELRPDSGQPWLRVRGAQYFATDPPGFVWWGRASLSPGLSIEACDESVAGSGRMRIKIVSTVTVADIRGAEIDQGALMRLLAEMVWFPGALLDARYVTWAPRDDASAEATLRVAGREVRGTFRFGADGLPRRMDAMRYRVEKGKSELAPWFGEMADFRLESGFLVPHRMEAGWQLPGGPFPYARFVLERIEYDQPEPF
jgi:hypothetical protein